MQHIALVNTSFFLLRMPISQSLPSFLLLSTPILPILLTYSVQCNRAPKGCTVRIKNIIADCIAFLLSLELLNLLFMNGLERNMSLLLWGIFNTFVIEKYFRNGTWLSEYLEEDLLTCQRLTTYVPVIIWFGCFWMHPDMNIVSATSTNSGTTLHTFHSTRSGSNALWVIYFIKWHACNTKAKLVRAFHSNTCEKAWAV